MCIYVYLCMYIYILTRNGRADYYSCILLMYSDLALSPPQLSDDAMYTPERQLPHTRTARAQPPSGTPPPAQPPLPPQIREHSPTARQPHSNGL